VLSPANGLPGGGPSPAEASPRATTSQHHSIEDQASTQALVGSSHIQTTTGPQVSMGQEGLRQLSMRKPGGGDIEGLPEESRTPLPVTCQCCRLVSRVLAFTVRELAREAAE
jgi:hypothetical protein